MDTNSKTKITITTTVNAKAETAWIIFNNPKFITKWCFASDDWHAPNAENDLSVGGKINVRMESKDGNYGFDFWGIYDKIEPNKFLAYTMGDDRKVEVNFESIGNTTKITETFEAEDTNSIEMQKLGWQAILDNFKNFTESLTTLVTLYFEIQINAPAEKVYKIMLDDSTYREWTALFNPTSHFVGTWEKGSEIRFLGSDNEGNIGGMISRIKDNIPNKYVSIEHLGIISGDKEFTSGMEVIGFDGALENYIFEELDGITTLKVELDTNSEYSDYFKSTWPIALEKLKSICEA